MSDDVPLGLLFGLLIVLLFLSAFFSSTETALVSLNRYRLRHRARSGHRPAQLAEKLLAGEVSHEAFVHAVTSAQMASLSQATLDLDRQRRCE